MLSPPEPKAAPVAGVPSVQVEGELASPALSQSPVCPAELGKQQEQIRRERCGQLWGGHGSTKPSLTPGGPQQESCPGLGDPRLIPAP